MALVSSPLFDQMSAASDSAQKSIILALLRPRRRLVGDVGRFPWSDLAMVLRSALPVPFLVPLSLTA